MSKLNLYQEMRRELEARKAPLLEERKKLEAAATRIDAIDAHVAFIDAEIAEYDAAIKPLMPAAEVPTKLDRALSIIDAATERGDLA